MRIQPGTLGMTILLAAMTSLGPLSTDIYVASLPHIGEALHAPTGEVQLTITCYLVGYAIGQIFYGPVSDKFGRRPPLLAGYALYIVAAIGCLFVNSIGWLIVARVAQAFGGAGPIILARAIVRDSHAGRAAAKQFGLMSTIMGVTPIVAPVVGGFLQAAFGWRSGFVVMAGFGVTFGAIVAFLLPETNMRRQPGPISFASVWESYAIVFRNKAYRAYLVMQACSFNGLFGFVSSSSHVLQKVYGLSAPQFGLAFAMCSMSYVAGAFTASRLVTRLGIDRMIGIGVGLECAAGIVMTLAQILTPWTFLSVIFPYMMFFLGVGFLLAQAQAAALTPFPERAGAASSLMGFIQMTSGAIIGTITGMALGATAWPLVIVTLVSGGLAFLAFHLSVGVRRDLAPVTRSFGRP